MLLIRYASIWLISPGHLITLYFHILGIPFFKICLVRIWYYVSLLYSEIIILRTLTEACLPFLHIGCEWHRFYQRLAKICFAHIGLVTTRFHDEWTFLNEYRREPKFHLFLFIIYICIYREYELVHKLNCYSILNRNRSNISTRNVNFLSCLWKNSWRGNNCRFDINLEVGYFYCSIGNIMETFSYDYSLRQDEAFYCKVSYVNFHKHHMIIININHSYLTVIQHIGNCTCAVSLYLWKFNILLYRNYVQTPNFMNLNGTRRTEQLI